MFCVLFLVLVLGSELVSSQTHLEPLNKNQLRNLKWDRENAQITEYIDGGIRGLYANVVDMAIRGETEWIGKHCHPTMTEALHNGDYKWMIRNDHIDLAIQKKINESIHKRIVSLFPDSHLSIFDNNQCLTFEIKW